MAKRYDYPARYVVRDLHGTGARRVLVFAVPVVNPAEYWPNVTDIGCPVARCVGLVRWAEAGYVPGYRICDACGRHYRAGGTLAAPVLLRVR